MEKKMDEITKVKLIYSGELLIFAIAFLVIGILEVTHVMGLKDFIINIFNIGSIFGALFIIVTFFWTLLSPKRREKASLFDKATLLPLAIYILVIDIIMFMHFSDEKRLPIETYQYFIGFTLIGFGTSYLIQAIYHWFRPLKSLLDEIESERISKVSFKIDEIKEDGSIIATNIYDEEKYLFKKEDGIKESEEIICLDLYPGITPSKLEDNKEEK